MPRSGFSPSRVAPVGALVAGVLAGQPATGQRRPRQDADALVAAHVEDLELDVADEQVVLRLQRDDRRGVDRRSSAAFCSCHPTKLLTPA